jgi:uncharacterized DUF497 family protein
MENRLEYIFEKYNIVEEDQREIIEIFNKSLIEISDGILGNKNKVKKEKEKGEKRWASKKASEYAEENGVSLEEVEGIKITKKEIEEYVKQRVREGKETKISTKVNTEKSEKRCMCSGITNKGEACNKVGVEKPEGAKRKYCVKHSVDWRTYECDTDSSESEVETES